MPLVGKYRIDLCHFERAKSKVSKGDGHIMRNMRYIQESKSFTYGTDTDIRDQIDGRKVS